MDGNPPGIGVITRFTGAHGIRISGTTIMDGIIIGSTFITAITADGGTAGMIAGMISITGGSVPVQIIIMEEGRGANLKGTIHVPKWSTADPMILSEITPMHQLLNITHRFMTIQESANQFVVRAILKTRFGINNMMA